MLFSFRKGLKPIKSIMQVDSMDDDLRNTLWNALKIFYWNKVNSTNYNIQNINNLVENIWIFFLKKPIDEKSPYWSNVYQFLRDLFFRFEWNEVYDFIEFIVQNYSGFESEENNYNFKQFCNITLEKELSAFRFVGDEIVDITSQEEILEIEEALTDTKPLKNVNTHLKRALELISDRKSPDYRNSMKESISAVEAMCCIIKGEKATLGQALKVLKDRVGLHSALEKAFSMLYGYSNDADGIRHSLMEESSLEFEDAKFMLVSCSAFINYLLAKAAKAGIDI